MIEDGLINGKDAAEFLGGATCLTSWFRSQKTASPSCGVVR